LVSVRHPDHCRDGYMPAYDDVLVFVDVDNYVIAGPRETVEVPIVLNIPEDIETGNEPYEFWVTVMDANSGMVATELCQRWLINGE
jgi:hypothetical protein